MMPASSACMYAAACEMSRWLKKWSRSDADTVARPCGAHSADTGTFEEKSRRVRRGRMIQIILAIEIE